MKKIFTFIFLVTLLVGICFGELAESLENHFTSISANDDGVLIVLQKTTVPYRVSVHSYGALAEENDPKMKSNSEAGEYFIPYGFKWPVRIGQRDFGFRFYPLENGDDRKGFLIREQNLFLGGRDEFFGVFLYLANALSNEPSYKIVDEKIYKITYQDGGVETTNVYTRADAEQSSVPKTSIPVIESTLSDTEQPVQESNVAVLQTNNTPVKTTSEEAKLTNFNWGLIFPAIGVLLVGLFALFKLKKR